MFKKRIKSKVADLRSFSSCKNENRKRGSLFLMLSQYSLEHLYSVLYWQLLLNHGMQDKVHDSKKSGHFLVRVTVFLAKSVVNVVEIQN